MNHPLDPTTTAFDRVRALYDPELFRSTGHQLIDTLSRHLEHCRTSTGPVLPWSDPQALTQTALASLAQHTADTHGGSPAAIVPRFQQLVEQALAHSIKLHDPRYVGHQVPPPIPLASLCDALGGVINNPMAVYEMGPWVTAIEQALIRTLLGQVGWQYPASGGIVTHGASLANLTAVLVARNVRLGSAWEQGLAGHSGPAPKLVVQADAHYCLARGAGITGLGTSHVVAAPLDARRRMCPQQLDELLATLRRAGHPVIAVAASSCATPIGAFDPLDQVAEVCRRHDVWLHVDAAHGGATLLSPRHRHLLAGIDQADSVTWDAHKMLYVPALCAFLLYRDQRHSYEAFRQNAPYLFDPAAPGMAEFDGALRTVECTKRGAALGLWGLWSLFGPGLFADLVDVTFDLAQTLYQKLQAADDFEPLHEPQCNIVVFRHRPAALRDAPPAVLSEFQRTLRRTVMESGEYYLVGTTLDGQAALRCTLMHPLTTPDHLDGLLQTLRAVGTRCLASATPPLPGAPL
jgi:L-2,4-diaminobutyrate decarboxylase